MRITIWVLLGLSLVGGVCFWLFQSFFGKEDSEYILKLIQQKQKEGTIAMEINYNDEKLVGVNTDSKLPLASTMKIIVAIEFARQAAEGMVDPNQEVHLKELEKFYIPKTDGGAHEAWTKSLHKDDEEKNTVSLFKVTKGMIGYSSNANTDYLMNVLGLENINSLIEEMELTNHDKVYPIVAAFYIPLQLMNEEQITKESLLGELEGMGMTEYSERAIAISSEWQDTPITTEQKEELVKTLGMDIQKVWSDRLPGATTSDYMDIMVKLNNKEYFSNEVYHYLNPIMEQLMENSANQKWLEHAGQKGGSTAFVVTMAMYATDKDGNKTEMVFLADDLSRREQRKVSGAMNGFQLNFLRDSDFREKVKTELRKK